MNLTVLVIGFWLGMILGNWGGAVTGDAVKSAIRNCESHSGLKSIEQNNFLKPSISDKYTAVCNDNVVISGGDAVEGAK